MKCYVKEKIVHQGEEKKYNYMAERKGEYLLN